MTEFKNHIYSNNNEKQKINNFFINQTETKIKINKLLNLDNLYFKIFNGIEILEKNWENIEKYDYIDEYVLINNINFTLFHGKKLLGILSLNKNQNKEENISLDFIEINSDFQNKGLSKILIEKMFEYINNNGYTLLEITPYSELGKKFLQRNIENSAKKFPSIKIKNRSYIIHSRRIK